MLLKQPIEKIFSQLTEALMRLTPEEYTRPSNTLSNASIGQHVRHIIELFLCLEQGYDTGKVNYEKRKRDTEIETNKELAICLLQEIYQRLDRPNADLELQAENFENSGEPITIPSNYFRELAYNLEHTIHHMALIRIGISEISSIDVAPSFGVAHSTIKYRQQCAQ